RDAADAVPGALVHPLRPRRRRFRVRPVDLPAGRASPRARHRARRVKIAVVGQRGAWSTGRLAAALRAAGAEAPVIDLAACSLRLPDRRLFHRGLPLDGLDGAGWRKIGDTTVGWWD